MKATILQPVSVVTEGRNKKTEASMMLRII
jgi:hypothetical protein